jgi:hypothetical protein
LYHAATLLADGRVLIAGGLVAAAQTAELYDPATGIWTRTGDLTTPRVELTLTLLPNGKVLAAGGYFGVTGLASAELYDPATGTWTTTGSMAIAHSAHTATLLPDGRVLVASGAYSDPASAEFYDPASGTWTRIGDPAPSRYKSTATLLLDGNVLVAAGLTNVSSANAELYDVGVGFKPPWQPRIRGLQFTPSKRLLLKGSLFQGLSEASSGNTADSSSNYPVVQCAQYRFRCNCISFR